MGMERILVTGGAGFIGSNFIHHILAQDDGPSVVNLDKLTYAGNLANLKDIEDNPRYRFVKGDIADTKAVDAVVKDGVDAIVNFAAESHVDRSIHDPEAFIRTDLIGTHVLLEAARAHNVSRYLQVSTDEVYGDVEPGQWSRETDTLKPSSPYSASKAGADLLVLAYARTYGLPTLITRCTNNYGPYHYPEKLIPLFITNAIDDQPLPIYGDGQQVRDWLYVEDHCAAIDLVLRRGTPGEIYNVGALNEPEVTNLMVTDAILHALGKPDTLKKRVTDRPGHDRRYALDTTKIRALGWSPETDFAAGIAKTVDWFTTHESWWRDIKESDEFRRFYDRQYRMGETHGRS